MNRCKYCCYFGIETKNENIKPECSTAPYAFMYICRTYKTKQAIGQIYNTKQTNGLTYKKTHNNIG